ncbi:MAG: hypothetical protein OFPII_43440 [Osedax symbiont Rs1]|nr:MAG: hypothetical protein OFPII_43440 [Osedax symbiont Rs1]
MIDWVEWRRSPPSARRSAASPIKGTPLQRKHEIKRLILSLLDD